FSLCGRCHNVLLKLNPAKTEKNLTNKATDIIIDKATNVITDKAIDVVTNKVINIVMDNAKDELTDVITDIAMNVESVSTVDEFLLSIHNKIIILTKDNSLLPTDYSIAFKTQKETGVGTQLADTQDFIKFKAECLKVATKSIDMGVYVTIMQASQIKEKKKDTKSNNNDDKDNYKNSNKVPNASSLLSQDQAIAKNNKGLSMIKDPPTHSLFSYNRISSKKRYLPKSPLLQESLPVQTPFSLQTHSLPQASLLSQASSVPLSQVQSN
ncbi:10748_t:CDS:2, partial [Scutellospora calospora]